MKFTSLRPRILSSSVAALLGLALGSSPATAQVAEGVFSDSGTLGTADMTGQVGLSTSKTYLQKIDLGDGGTRDVNGVLFTGGTTAGAGWSFSGANLVAGGGATPVPAGAVGALTESFLYNGFPATLTLTGLTVGETYVITFYNRSWDPAGQRVQNMSAGGASVGTGVYDIDVGAAGRGELNLERYTFQAATTTQTITATPQTGNSYHFGAFTTEQTFNNAWTGGTTWTNSTWAGGQPNGSGSNANFAAAAPASIALDAARTVGHIQFGGAGAGTSAWTITGANTLTLQADIGGTSTLSTTAGSHQISTPVVLATNTAKFGGGTLNLSGPVSGAGGLIVSGGTLNLTGAASYTGTTRIGAGATLQVGSGSSLGAGSGALTMGAGSVLELNGATASVGAFSGAGTIRNQATGTAASLTLGNGNGTGVFTGTILDHATGTGTVSLTKIGTGTITLGGALSYTGPTTISAGRLQLESAAVGTLPSSSVTIGGTGTLGFSAAAPSTLTLSGGLTLNAGSTLAMDFGAPGALSDRINGQSLTLIGGNSTINLNPIYTPIIGQTYTVASFANPITTNGFAFNPIVAGRLTLSPVIAGSNVTITPTLDDSRWNSPTGGTWSAGPWSSYTPTNIADAATFGTALTSSGTITVDTPRTVGVITFNNPTSSYTIGTAGSGNLTLNFATNSALIYNNAGNHTIAENINLASDLSIFSASGTNLTILGAVGGARGLNKVGTGTTTFVGPQGYTGSTNILEGTLQLGNGTTNGTLTGSIINSGVLAFNPTGTQAFGNALSGTGSISKLGGGTLAITTNSTLSGGASVSAGVLDLGNSTAAGNIDGPISVNSGATLQYTRTGVVTINNVVSGAGKTIIAGTTSQTLAATAAINTPILEVGRGATQQGWVAFGAANQMNGTTGVLLNITANTANSRINLNGFNQTISGLQGTGIVQNFESGTPAAATLTINSPAATSNSWTGLIRNQAGVLGLTKTGAGEQIMNFSITQPTYSGATTISQGRLIFGSTLGATTWSTSGIAVAASAELGFTAPTTWTATPLITGAGSVTRSGTDTNVFTLSNAGSSYTGPTILAGTGILATNVLANIGANSPIGRGDNASAATNAASLVLNGGKLRYTGGPVATDRLFTLTTAGGSIEASGTGVVNFNNSGSIGTSGSGVRTLTLDGTNTGNNILGAGIVNGAGGATSVTKNGAGTWVLSGASTYTGATQVNAGRLQFEGAGLNSSTSGLTLAATSTLGLSAGTGSTLSLLAGGLNLAGGTLAYDLGGAATSDRITATGPITISAATAFTFNQIGAYSFGTQYTLISGSAINNPGGSALTGTTAGRLSLAPVISGNSIVMTPTLDNAAWALTTGGAWSNPLSWNGYVPTIAGDAALFGTALTAPTGAVAVDAPFTVGYMTFNNATSSYTVGSNFSTNLTIGNVGTALASIVVNAGSHTIQENTTLASNVVVFTDPATRISLAGTFTGADKTLTKNGPGTLVIGNGNALASVGTLILNTGVVDLDASTTIVGNLGGTGGTITDSNINAGTSSLTVTGAGTTTYEGAIIDGPARNLSLFKAGTGTLVLAGSAPTTFTGGVTITGGILRAQKTGGPAFVSNVTIGDQLGGDILEIGANEQIADTATVTFNSGLGGNSAILRLLSNTETVRAITTTVGQAAVIENNAAGVGTLIVNTSDLNDSPIFDGIIRNGAAGQVALTKAGPGTLTLKNTAQVVGTDYNGPTNINAGKLVLDDLGAFGGTTVTINSTADRAFTINNTTRDLTTGLILAGTGEFVVSAGSRTLTLVTASAFAGRTVVESGTLGLGGDNVLGNSTIVMRGGIIRAANAGRTLANPVTVEGDFTLGRVTNLIGPISLTTNATITANNFDNPADNPSNLGAIGGNFQISFAEGPQGIGTGSLNITGVNTNTGGTRVLSGRVIVNPGGALSNTPLTVNGGELITNNLAQSVTSLEGTGGRLIANGALNLVQAGDTTFAGALGGTGTFTKSGPGTLNLTGADPALPAVPLARTGANNLNDGVLNLTGVLRGSALNINVGTLTGTGSAISPVNVASGTTISPGIGGVGTLNLGATSLAANSTYAYDFNTSSIVDDIGASDLLAITGNLNIATGSKLNLNDVGAHGVLAEGTLFIFATYTGTWSGGLFDIENVGIQPNGGEFQFESNTYQVYYDLGLAGSQRAALVVVPEPGAALSMLGGLGLLLARRRRRSA